MCHFTPFTVVSNGLCCACVCNVCITRRTRIRPHSPCARSRFFFSIAFSSILANQMANLSKQRCKQTVSRSLLLILHALFEKTIVNACVFNVYNVYCVDKTSVVSFLLAVYSCLWCMHASTLTSSNSTLAIFRFHIKHRRIYTTDIMLSPIVLALYVRFVCLFICVVSHFAYIKCNNSTYRVVCFGRDDDGKNSMILLALLPLLAGMAKHRNAVVDNRFSWTNISSFGLFQSVLQFNCSTSLFINIQTIKVLRVIAPHHFESQRNV